MPTLTAQGGAPQHVVLGTSSPVIGRSLVRMLAREQLRVTEARSAAELSKLLGERSADLFLIQDELSDGSGLELCERFARGGADGGVPIIVFSRDESVGDEALSRGASAFVKVPVPPDRLHRLLEQWSQMARSYSQAREATGSAPSAGDEAASEAPSTAEGGRTVLIVDDSSVVRQFVGGALESAGYRVIRASDGVEGLEKAGAHLPDLIISDLDMPRMDGFEMCRRVKEGAATKEIPIVILSARGAGMDIDRGFDSGANDFLTKPVSENELLSRVDLMLGGEERARERVLVVEDSALQRRVVVQGLAQQGFEVLEAADGVEGLEVALQSLPDLVVTDSEMPRMNGRDLTREIRNHEQLRDVPVIMLTAVDSELNRTKGEHAGVSAYLSKPFVPDKVVVIAEKLIGERRLVREREAIQHYVSDAAAAAAAEIAEGKGDVHSMRAESRFATIFFSDIVGFTPLTESLSPEGLVGLLNEYFDRMAPIFRANEGVIDKFVGDAIMGIFVGKDEAAHAEAAYHAVKTGLEMIGALPDLNAKHDTNLNVRVGVNSGEVVMGDIGSRLYRRDYTVIGDHVNVAARLESAAEHGTVYVSATTHGLVADRVRATEIGPVSVKGKSEPIPVFRIDGLLEGAGAGGGG